MVTDDDVFGLRKKHISRQQILKRALHQFPELDQKFHNPGEKVIAAYISANYFKQEDLYAHRMCQMTAVPYY